MEAGHEDVSGFVSLLKSSPNLFSLLPGWENPVAERGDVILFDLFTVFPGFAPVNGQQLVDLTRMINVVIGDGQHDFE